nr:hypothetical protein [Tanacetum cinerariifolium]
YILESDPEGDLEEDNEDPEGDPSDYPTDREDDDEEEESSGDDADDEEEEHPTSTDSVPPPIHRVTARILRAKSPSTSHPLPSSTPPSGTPPLLPIPLPTSSPPLLLPSMSRRADVPEVTLPPRKRLCIAFGPRFKVGESSSTPTARPTKGFRADYRFVGTLDDEIRRDPEREVGYRITYTGDEMVEDMQGTPAATDVAGLSQRG